MRWATAVWDVIPLFPKEDMQQRIGQAVAWHASRWTKGWCVSMIAVLGVCPLFPPCQVQAQADFPSSARTTVQDMNTPSTGQRRQDTKAGSVRVTLMAQDSSLDYVLRSLAHKSKRQIVYNSIGPAFAKRVNVRLVNVDILDAVAAVLKESGLTMSLAPDGETIVIRPIPDSEKSKKSITATGIITGRIVDSVTHEGLVSVNVAIRGSKHSTLTDKKGVFEFRNVPVGTYTIDFKLLGYKNTSNTVEVVEDKAASMQVVLASTATMLSGVVTTATGKQNRREVGSAVTSINVDSVMQVAPIATLTDLLEARVPGLTVQRASGQPGDPSRLRLRGSSSITGNNDPIVYVDGIRMYTDASLSKTQAIRPGTLGSNRPLYSAPSALDQIDPNEIETIDVFKGPSATAMFGSDAANGVIVITTKKGKAGPAHWSVAMNTGLSYVPGKYPESIFAYASFQGMQDFIVFGDSYFSVRQQGIQIDSLVRFSALADERYTPFAHGTNQGLSATVSGGSQALQYRVTMGGTNDIGLLKMPDRIATQYRETYGTTQPGWMKRPDRYNTWNGGGTFTANISPEVRLSLSTSLMSSEQRHSALGNSVITLFMALPPDSMVASYTDRFYERNINASLKSSHTADFNWQITPSIPLGITAGVSTLVRTDESLLPRGIRVSLDALGTTDSVGKYAVARSTAASRTMRATTRLPTGFQQLTVLAGTNLEWETSNQMHAWVLSLPPGVNEPDVGLSGRQGTSARTIFGWYLQPQFNLKSRFFIIPGFRIDNTSLAGSNAKFMRLPKMQLSWVVSEEPLFPLKNLFSELRLRTSFGVSATQPNAAARLRLVALDTLPSTPGLYQNGATISTLGNTTLRPEASEELEGGFEATFLGGRIGLEMTGYRKTRKDAIVDAPLAYSVAVANSLPSNSRNIGVVRNSGLEVVMSGQVFENPTLGWSNQLMFSHNTNRVVRLNAGQDPISIEVGNSRNSLSRIVAGYPIFGRWSRQMIGFADADGDGIIAPEEVVLKDEPVYVGQQEPTMEAAYSSSVSLFQNRIRISATVAYVGGGLQTNSAMGETYSPAGTSVFDSTLTLEQQARMVAARLTGFHEKVSTIRFQTFSVNYQVPASIARRFRSQSMMMAIQGANLGLKTNYSGKDPNVNGDPAGNSTFDPGLLAQPRSWSLRFTLNN